MVNLTPSSALWLVQINHSRSTKSWLNLDQSASHGDFLSMSEALAELLQVILVGPSGGWGLCQLRLGILKINLLVEHHSEHTRARVCVCVWSVCVYDREK